MLVPKSTTVSNCESLINNCWNEVKELEFLKLIQEEAKNLQKQRRTNEKLCWMEVIKRVKINNSAYRNYTIHLLRCRIRTIRVFANNDKSGSYATR